MIFHLLNNRADDVIRLDAVLDREALPPAGRERDAVLRVSYESGEVGYTGRVTKRGDKMARTYLFEAAPCSPATSADRACATGRAIAKRTGPRKARVALARKLAVILHAMWRSGLPFEDRGAA